MAAGLVLLPFAPVRVMAAPAAPTLPGEGKQAGERREISLAPNLKVAFRWCPAGTFTMGGTDPQAGATEKPVRKVDLTQGFWLAETEFTQAQWEVCFGRQAMLNQLLSSGGGSVISEPEHPMRLVAWDHICGNKERTGGVLGKVNAFFHAQKVTGWVADLPTEAQWEYACRAGTGAAFAGTGTGAADAAKVAWFRDNSGGTVQPVGRKEANPWGLRDLHGNISEWCRDWFVETYDGQPARDPAGPASGWKRVIRGGAYVSAARGCRASARVEAYPSEPHPAVGFRLALRHGNPAPPKAKPAPAKKPPAKPPAKKAPPKKAPAKPKGKK